MDHFSWIPGGFGSVVTAVVSLFGGVGTLAIMYLVKHRQQKAEKLQAEKTASQKTVSFEYFSAPDDQQFNEPFYDYLIDRIKNAKRHIYLSGEGFGEYSGRIADKYFEATRRALTNNIRIVRVQTTRDTSELWIGMLEQLVRDFPSSFELFALREPDHAQMTSICVIDPESRENCVVEMDDHITGNVRLPSCQSRRSCRFHQRRHAACD